MYSFICIFHVFSIQKYVTVQINSDQKAVNWTHLYLNMDAAIKGVYGISTSDMALPLDIEYFMELFNNIVVEQLLGLLQLNIPGALAAVNSNVADPAVTDLVNQLATAISDTVETLTNFSGDPATLAEL